MNRTWTAALLLALAAVPAGASHVESLCRIPPRRASETAGGPSRALAISADGRYTVLASEAANLVPGMAAAPVGVYLFLYDRVAGETVQISRRAVESPDSYPPTASLTPDGRFVAFQSRATGEIEGQNEANSGFDVFLWDRDTGETTLVSRSEADPVRTGNGSSNDPAVSGDGRFVAFTSDATDLVEGFTATSSNVFLWDRQTEEIEPVSRSAGAPGRLANANSLFPSISADGRFVAFLSLASDLVPGQVDRNTARGTVDVFLWDRTTRQTVLVSRSAGNPLVTGNRASQRVLISANGRFAAFESFATDLLPGQRAGGENIFLWDRVTGEMSLVSRGPRGNPARGGDMFLTAVTPGGSHVLFSGDAKNLLTNPDEGSSTFNVFLWSRATGKTTLVSRSTTRGRGGNFHSIATGLSADGTWIVFESIASDLDVQGSAARDNHPDVFLANGRSGRITLLSGPAPSAVETIDRFSTGALISADGRWIAFTSNAADFGEGVRDSNGTTDVVLASRGGARTIVTVHPPGLASATPPGSSFATSIDASGRFVVFASNVDAALLVPGVRELEANRFGSDVFLYDRELRTLALVTRSGTDPRFTADGSSSEARISADGRWVAFTSSARDLLPEVISGTGLGHVYLWDRTTGQTTLVSRAAGSSSTAGADDFSQDPRISADGSVVVFQSQATDLVAGQIDTHGTDDIFLFDRTTGTVSLVSRAAGSATTAADRFSFLPKVSADGRIVAFSSTATHLVPGVTDTNEDYEAFLFDRATGTMTLASRTTAPAPTAGTGLGLALSADGRFLVFASLAADLVPGQSEPRLNHDLFLFDRIAGTTTLVTHVAGSLTTAASVGTGEADISADGRFTAFTSTAPNLVPGQVDAEIEGASNDVFVFDRETGALERITRAAGTVATGGPGESAIPRISADGRRVAFFSNRLDLAPALHGSGTAYNLYVHDRPTGTATLVTHVLGDPTRPSAGNPPEFLFSAGLFLSANGTVAAFTSAAPGLVPRDFNRLPDAFAATVP